jgi:hypothetical protein
MISAGKSTVVFISTFLLVSCSKTERVDVSDLKCDSISTNITPREVGQQPFQFVGRCISWAGTVTAIVESQPCSIEVPGRYVYLGKSIVDIRALPSGRAIGNQTLGDRVEEDIPVRCILGRGRPKFQQGDLIELTGKIIAQTKMASLSLTKQMRQAPVIGIASIHTVQHDSIGNN